MQYWGVSLNWFDWLQLVLAVIAVALGLSILIPAARQYYLDHWSKWPYETPYIGREKEILSSQMITLAFRFENHTTREAFFEIGIVLPGDSGRWVPSHVSVWPSGEKAGLWVSVPPKSSREIQVSPFGPQFPDRPKTWTLKITEYRHQKRPVVLKWPEDLDRVIDRVATLIPPATS